MVLPIEEVRSLAASHGYKEIQHNATSRAIIFRDNSGRMQVNVYYTTGTVGTCLNHPKQGKTQLFRRGVHTVEVLSTIFQNPRAVHTGTGYKLRKNMWQPDEKKSGSNTSSEQDEEPERDLVRRWRYVCAATDLCKTRQEEENVLQFCKLWNAVEFPSLVDSSNMENLRPGAGCVLWNLMAETAAKKHGMLQALDFMADNESDRSLIRIDSNEATCYCPDGVQFKKLYADELSELQRLLLSEFSNTTCEQLLIWFFARHRSGNLLVRTDSGRFGEPDAMFPRDDVDEIHREYSKLYYPQKTKRCLLCDRLVAQVSYVDTYYRTARLQQ
jgi:hypothetical protein